MSAHTPGPWPLKLSVVQGTDGTMHPHAEIGAGRVNGKYFSVSGCISEDDARLIAAAPELLEALDVIASFAFGHGDVCEIIAKRARAAIAKATGGAA